MGIIYFGAQRKGWFETSEPNGNSAYDLVLTYGFLNFDRQPAESVAIRIFVLPTAGLAANIDSFLRETLYPILDPER